MKKTLSILLTLTMLVSLSVPAFAATTDTTNSGYVVVSENFESFVATDSMSSLTAGTAYPIGENTYWTLKTNSSTNPGPFNHTNGYIYNDGTEEAPDMKLFVNSGGLDFDNAVNRRSTVYYDGNYSKVGNNFKITFDFKKATVGIGTAVKFMLSNDIKSYYALNMETCSTNYPNNNVWKLYKVVNNGTPTVLAQSNELITSNTDNTGNGGTNRGTITIAYDNGKISWDISANRYGDHAYAATGSYTDPNPFTTLPSECKFGFSTNTGSRAEQGVSIDNIKFSYSVPCLDEDFSSLTASDVANTGAKQRTQITGTDFYVTSRTNPLNAKLTANAADAQVISGTTTGLKLQYNYASFLSHGNQLDFAEYRGDYSGLGDDYTISFEYYSGQARNSAYFYFGLPANASDNYTYNDYYMFMINGLSEANYYNKANVTTIPSWEIRKFEGGDTPSDVIVKSDNIFEFKGTNVGGSDATTLAGKGTGKAAITLTVKNGVATINVTGKIGDNTYTDTKTFNVGTMAGNHFAFSSGSEKTAALYDNILVEANDDPVEYRDGKVYIVGGKFASRGGVALFALEDGTYRIENVTMNTHEKKVMNVPENATKMFFWRDFSTVRPLVASIEF